MILWNEEEYNCGMAFIRSIISHKWNCCILLQLHKGNKGFKELERAIGQGVSQKVLTQRLKQLERDGFIHRTVLPTTPPQVEYSITPLGIEAYFLLQNILSWYNLHLKPLTGTPGSGCIFKR